MGMMWLRKKQHKTITPHKCRCVKSIWLKVFLTSFFLNFKRTHRMYICVVSSITYRTMSNIFPFTQFHFLLVVSDAFILKITSIKTYVENLRHTTMLKIFMPREKYIFQTERNFFSQTSLFPLSFVGIEETTRHDATHSTLICTFVENSIEKINKNKHTRKHTYTWLEVRKL